MSLPWNVEKKGAISPPASRWGAVPCTVRSSGLPPHAGRQAPRVTRGRCVASLPDTVWIETTGPGIVSGEEALGDLEGEASRVSSIGDRPEVVPTSVRLSARYVA